MMIKILFLAWMTFGLYNAYSVYKNQNVFKGQDIDKIKNMFKLYGIDKMRKTITFLTIISIIWLFVVMFCYELSFMHIFNSQLSYSPIFVFACLMGVMRYRDLCRIFDILKVNHNKDKNNENIDNIVDELLIYNQETPLNILFVYFNAAVATYSFIFI